MKEIILNHFASIGAILFVVVVYTIKEYMYDEDNIKWAVLGLWIIFSFSLLGMLSTFNAIGKWLLK